MTPSKIKTIGRLGRGTGWGDKILASVEPDRPGYLLRIEDGRDIFNPDFRLIPGRIDFAPDVLDWAECAPEGCILVHPYSRHGGGNKEWGRERYSEAVARSGRRFVQCLAPGHEALPGVTAVETPSFWHAAAVLARSVGYLGGEGAFSHAAGALGKPAVVIFGAFNSPALLGYPWHVNLEAPDPECLGRREAHPACRAAMDRITVGQVLKAMEAAFGAEGLDTADRDQSVRPDALVNGRGLRGEGKAPG